MLLRGLTLKVVVATLLLAASGCGSSGSNSTASGGTGRSEAAELRPFGAGSATAATVADQPRAGAPRGGACDLLTREEVSAAIGRTVTAATVKESGGLKECFYSFGGRDPDASPAVVVWFSTDSGERAAFDFTKGNGDPVPGLGDEAVWFGAELKVRAKGGVLDVNMTISDVTINGGDLKSVAVRLARTALERI